LRQVRRSDAPKSANSGMARTLPKRLSLAYRRCRANATARELDSVRHDGAERRPYERLNQCSLAAHAMRDGPSDSGCRVWVQTTKSGVGPMADVVSVLDKARRTRQVCAGKTNVSEPSLTCRKLVGRCRNQAVESGLGQARRTTCLLSERRPAWRRRELSAGVCAERGNLPLDAKGDVQVVDPTRTRVPMRRGGTDGFVVAMKPGNAGGAKEPALSGVRDWSTREGRS
jgi:hypothetical protein